MKSTMVASLKQRFQNIEKMEFLVIATLLDPRFKDKFSSDPETELCTTTTRKEELGTSATVKDETTASSHLPKRPCTDLWQSFSEILEESGACPIDFNPDIDTHVDKYPV